MTALLGDSHYQQSDIDAEVAGLLQRIEASKFGGTSANFDNISLDFWEALCDKISHSAKAEYCIHTRVLVVTWRTDVHSAFKPLISPLVDIAQQIPEFSWETNTQIQLYQGPHSGDCLTPDFAFGKARSGGGVDFPIVLECAVSQSTNSLDERAEKFLTRSDVRCVLGLNFVSPDFRAPDYPAEIDTEAVNHWSRFQAEANISSDRGPVIFQSHTWAPEITQIVFTVWLKTNDTQASRTDFSLPSEAEQVTSTLRKITHHLVGPHIFNTLYSSPAPAPEPKSNTPQNFTIDWQHFATDLRRRLISDAFRRYYQWVQASSSMKDTTAVTVTEEPFLLKRIREAFGAESDDEDMDGDVGETPAKR